MINEKDAVYALKQVKAILDREEIIYWLDCGTLLGAIRNGRIIPWDDDIDLGAFSKDKKKVKKILNTQLPNTFEINHYLEETKVYFKGFDLSITFYSINNGHAVRHYKKIEEPYIISVLRSISNMLEISSDRNITKASQNVPVQATRLIAYIISNLPLKFKCIMSGVLNIIIHKFSLYSYLKVVIPLKYFKNLSKITFYGMEFNIPSSVEEYLGYRYGKDWRTPISDYVYNEEDGAISDKYERGY